ncbi:MAG: exo-alpha-sialidase [Nitriliruptorales bacterium]|nr:exo-alpha-sialidase [Nitriliruptorales bacterium]
MTFLRRHRPCHRSAAALLALGLLVPACTGSATPMSARSQAAAEDPGLIHVHELAVEPDGAEVYAATHTGLFRIRDGVAERVGDHFHDLMGFTITDQGDFLASGHPDLRTSELEVAEKPPLLGLVESRDRGQSWVPISLLGEVDFHALEVRGDTVYGADATSGRFMVSDDGGETWSTRSQPGVTDFDVSPSDSEVIIATGGSGALRSRNGGRTWNQLQTSPLAVLAWRGKTIYGAWPDGTVVVSNDDGDTWQQRRSLPGPPEALLVTDDSVMAAAGGTGIVASTDRGRTWNVVYRLEQPQEPSP